MFSLYCIQGECIKYRQACFWCLCLMVKNTSQDKFMIITNKMDVVLGLLDVCVSMVIAFGDRVLYFIFALLFLSHHNQIHSITKRIHRHGVLFNTAQTDKLFLPYPNKQFCQSPITINHNVVHVLFPAYLSLIRPENSYQSLISTPSESCTCNYEYQVFCVKTEAVANSALIYPCVTKNDTNEVIEKTNKNILILNVSVHLIKGRSHH